MYETTSIRANTKGSMALYVYGRSVRLALRKRIVWSQPELTLIMCNTKVDLCMCWASLARLRVLGFLALGLVCDRIFSRRLEATRLPCVY